MKAGVAKSSTNLHVSELPPIHRYDRPQSVSALEIGHIVLAFENDQLGWWEAVILEKKDGQFKLAWNGCPDQPHFYRSQNQLALMCPSGVVEH